MNLSDIRTGNYNRFILHECFNYFK